MSITSVSAASISIPSPLPAKEEKKHSPAKVAQGAIQALAGHDVKLSSSQGALKLSSERRTELLQDMMQLETPDLADICKIPAFKLKLTESEKKLMDSMFESWSLTKGICLLDLWALDLYTQIKGLVPEILKMKQGALIKPVKEALTYFCSLFLNGYISISAEKNLKSPKAIQIPETSFFQRKKKVDRFCPVMTRKEWALRLSDIQNALQKELAEGLKQSDTLAAQFAEVKAKFQFGRGLITHKHALTFLGDLNLRGLEQFFPKIACIEKPDPHKTLKHLQLYATFLDEATKCGREKGYLCLSPSIFNDFVKALHLINELEDPKKLEAGKQLKAEICDLFSVLKVSVDFNTACLALAQNTGKLTADIYFTTTAALFGSNENEDSDASTKLPSEIVLQKLHEVLHGKITVEKFKRDLGNPTFTLASSKTPAELIVYLTTTIFEFSCINGFITDLFELLDQRVFAVLFPEAAAPFYPLIFRLNINIQAILAKAGEIIQKSDTLEFPFSPPCLIKPEQEALFNCAMKALEMPTELFVMKCVSASADNFDERYRELLKGWSDLNARDIKVINYVNWIPFLKKFDQMISAFEEFSPHIKEIKHEAYQRIRSFLKALNPTVLNQFKDQWIDFIKDTILNKTLSYLRVAISVKDLKTVEGLHVNPSVSKDFEKLIPEEYVNLIEDVDDLVNEVLDAALPEVSEKPKRVQTELPSTSSVDEQEVFKIRRNEKMRKFQARLAKAADIGQKPFAKGGGSHRQLESEDGKIQGTLPTGGKGHREISLTVAKSWAKSINEHKA